MGTAGQNEISPFLGHPEQIGPQTRPLPWPPGSLPSTLFCERPSSLVTGLPVKRDEAIETQGHPKVKEQSQSEALSCIPSSSLSSWEQFILSAGCLGARKGIKKENKNQPKPHYQKTVTIDIFVCFLKKFSIHL